MHVPVYFVMSKAVVEAGEATIFWQYQSRQRSWDLMTPKNRFVETRNPDSIQD